MILIIRTIIMYIVVIFSLRLMGKKQIGQLEPSELTVAIMISELATIPLSGIDVPLLHGIVPVLILSAVEILISILVIKTIRIRKFITGRPVIIVKNGVLDEITFRKTRFTSDDLITEMRMNGISDINEIQYAFLETGGQVSFILKKKYTPVTFADLNIDIPDDYLPFPIINKGIVLKENLEIIERNEEWLKKELKKQNYDNYKDILLLMANHNEIKFIQKRST